MKEIRKRENFDDSKETKKIEIKKRTARKGMENEDTEQAARNRLELVSIKSESLEKG